MAYLLALVCLVILQALEFIYEASDLMERFPFFIMLIDPLVVMMPFCIFGYTRAIQGDNPLKTVGDCWMHATPMIVVAALALPFWSMPGELKVYWIFQGRISESLWQPIALYGNSYLAVMGVCSFFYWLFQRKKAINTRKAAVREWVRHLQHIQLFIAASMTARIIVYFVFDESFPVDFVLAYTAAYLNYLLLTQANPPMYMKRTAPVPLVSQESTDQSRPEFVDDTDLALFKELERAMENGLFRENTLTLRVLAETCGTTTHQASAAINLCSGVNFYEWINGYRIKAACEALSETPQTVSEICYMVGFNSKSTFNTAFRKQMDCTPTEYRKKNAPR